MQTAIEALAAFAVLVLIRYAYIEIRRAVRLRMWRRRTREFETKRQWWKG